MSWFWWALICPFFWALSSAVDQFLARDYFTNQRTSFIILTGLTTVPFLVPFLIWAPGVLSIPLEQIGWILLAGLFYILAIYPYIAALESDDISTVIPIFRITPLMVLGFGYVFLGERITTEQFIICCVILAAAVGISWSFEHKTLRLKTLFLVILAALCFATQTIILRYSTLHVSTWAVVFWELVAWSFVGVIAFPLCRTARHHFLSVMRETKGSTYWFGVLQNILDVASTFCGIVALATAPSAGLVSLAGSLHPAIIFIVGGTAGLFFPRLFDRVNKTRQTSLKIVCIIVMIAGYYALYKTRLVLD